MQKLSNPSRKLHSLLRDKSLRSFFERANRRVKTHLNYALIRARHRALIHSKFDRTKLKVGFIVLTESTWKLEPLLRRMEDDEAFETAVVVTPLKTLDDVERQFEQERTKAYFSGRGGNSPVMTTPKELSNFDPDVVFLTNPHPIYDMLFYNKIYEHKLCCYVPYTHGVDKYNNSQSQYNQPFHNSMWRIFAPHEQSKKIYRTISFKKGKNVVVTGYPACEPFLNPSEVNSHPWKAQDREKLKIIWAPHHTIDEPTLPYADFLRYADDFVALADRYRQDVQWAFKPHPLLKSKLYKHPDWGRKRSDDYFEYWRAEDHCQLEEGGYVDLFKQSDAMIHDCASFLAEYLYLNKPVLFLQAVDNIRDFLSDFGVDAFEACEHARSFKDVESFVFDLCNKHFSDSSKRVAFYKNNIEPYFSPYPSEKIIRHIKENFPKLR